MNPVSFGSSKAEMAPNAPGWSHYHPPGKGVGNPFRTVVREREAVVEEVRGGRAAVGGTRRRRRR